MAMQRSMIGWLAAVSAVMTSLPQVVAAGATTVANATCPTEPWVTVKEEELHLSFVLLGSVAFVMAQFYLLNHGDLHICATSWNVISASICTFTGVLIGTSWNKCLTWFVIGAPEDAGPTKQLVVNAMACVAWYLILQLALALAAGVSKEDLVAAFSSSKTMETQPTEEDKEAKNRKNKEVELNLKCYAMLLGITNGASAQGFWGLLQQQVPRTEPWALAVLPVCFFTITLVFNIGTKLRTMVSGADGEEDECDRLWTKFTVETEDSCISMSTAHLLVQSLRFSITGLLPQANGNPPVGLVVSGGQTALLFFYGFALVGFVAILDFVVPKGLGRKKTQLKKFAANSGAFCLLYATGWWFDFVCGLGQGPSGKMVCALLITFLSFAFIFFLEWLASLECTSDDADKELEAMILPISLLVGFAWKQAFVAGFTQITEMEHIAPAPVETLVLAGCLVLVVVPAWRWHILPVVLQVSASSAKQKSAARIERSGSGGKGEALLKVDEKAHEGPRGLEQPGPGYVAPAPAPQTIQEPVRNGGGYVAAPPKTGFQMPQGGIDTLQLNLERMENRTRELETALSKSNAENQELRNVVQALQKQASDLAQEAARLAASSPNSPNSSAMFSPTAGRPQQVVMGSTGRPLFQPVVMSPQPLRVVSNTGTGSASGVSPNAGLSGSASRVGPVPQLSSPTTAAPTTISPTRVSPTNFAATQARPGFVRKL